MILLTHPKKYSLSFRTQTQSPQCVFHWVSLAVDDLYRGDGCLLQSNYHPKWPGRGVVQQEIMCLLWTLMIQWKQTNDPLRVSHRVQRLHHSRSIKTWKILLNGLPLSREGGWMYTMGLRKRERARERNNRKQRDGVVEAMKGGGMKNRLQRGRL